MNSRTRFLGAVLLVGVPTVATAQRPDTKSPHGQLAQPCAVCHSADAWSPARISTAFDHGKSGFPLQGAHTTVACRTCHTALTFKGVSRDCVSCHKDPHQGELGTTCGRCHTSRSFVDKTEMSRAHQLTRFPLTGAHVAVDCEGCHAGTASGQMSFVARSTACNDCHAKDYQAARTPDHAGGGFPRQCEQCHATVAWQTAKFDHSATRFPLTGFHLSMSCAQCHATGLYPAGALPTTCVGCHQRDYNATTTPNHPQAGFPTDCTACHSTATWAGAPFDHNQTGFPLTGAHGQTSCDQCHGDGVFKGKPTACASCHQADYNNAKDPNHVQAQFSTDCTGCHSTNTWAGANFNHNSTAFPLTGSHVQLTCDQCHGDGVFKGKPTTCVSCHQADFNRATNPNHQTSGFSTDCTSCHTTTTWTGATFNHSTTGFPLTGAHIQATCDQCHGDGVFKGKPTTCVSCHQTDFNNAQNPNHVASGYSTDCTACHSTSTWSGAAFDHNSTAFPLTGAHIQVLCNQCHGDGVYKGKPTACVSCHQTDFNNTTDPSHQQVQFSTDCVSCHTTTTWSSAQFASHDAQYFPIYSGKHRGRWSNDCSTCHIVPTDYRQFDCLACHQGAHRGKGYTSQQCYSCHPTGRS